MSKVQSLMEKRMRDLGAGSQRPREALPETLEEGLMEIAFLRGCEISSRHRAALLLRLHRAEMDHITDLEARRHKLEALFIPVTHLPTLIRTFEQKACPAKRSDPREKWKNLTVEQLEEIARQLKSLQ